jgi:GMP synthase (glutamine-hydrolysing)
MSAPRVLVVDGNEADVRNFQRSAIGHDTGTGYARVLSELDERVVCDIVCPADGPAPLPSGSGVDDYDGVAITGSALNIPQGGPPVQRQIELAQAVFEAGVPLFGSCWGLQVAVAAAGGSVRVNPRGREFGFARRVAVSEPGRNHPLLDGKPAVFEAPTVHRDDIETLPSGAVALASNDMGLQATAFSHRRGSFWGVQYHPEFGYLDIAAAAMRYDMALVTAGLFRDQAELHTFIADLRALHADPQNPALAWKYGLGPAILDERIRRAELHNWLQQCVLPRRNRRT